MLPVVDFIPSIRSSHKIRFLLPRRHDETDNSREGTIWATIRLRWFHH